jgi:hypothetical protein
MSKEPTYLAWRSAQLWALTYAFRIALRHAIEKRRVRQFFWTWHWWIGAWHAIAVGHLLGFDGAYYGTARFTRRRTARFNRRYLREAQARIADREKLAKRPS